MEVFAHIQEIKLLATLVFGFFCYRSLPKNSGEQKYWDISDEEQMENEQESHQQPHNNATENEGQNEGRQSMNQEPVEESDKENQIEVGKQISDNLQSLTGLKILQKRRYVPKRNKSAKTEENGGKTKKIRKIRKNKDLQCREGLAEISNILTQ